MVDRIELHFFGDTREVSASFKSYNSLIGHKIILHGVVSHDVARRAMQEADILVNIGNKSSYQLPSKVVEYASTGKPILNIAQIENDSSAAFLETYPNLLNLLDSDSEDANFQEQSEELLQFIVEMPVESDREAPDQWLSQFQVDVISTTYERILFSPSEHKNPT